LVTEGIWSYTYSSYLHQVHIQCTSPNTPLRGSAGLFTMQ
jgi:hypothetical protein